MSIRRLLREPLVHFLTIGLTLFVVYGRVSPGDSDSRRIVVSQSQVDDIMRQYQGVAHRAPTRAELSGLIDTWVRDEILYREGLSLGLDKNDPVIKRRIRQKYDLIAEEEERTDATDADLATFLKAHPAKFLRPATVSFDQILFDPSLTSPEAVEAVKVALTKGANPASFGQPSMLPRKLDDTSVDLVARSFGENFANKVSTMGIGDWVGPLASGFGVHLVRVKARTAPVLPPLEEVRTAVSREWESDRRARSSATSFRRVRADYDVVVKARVP